MSAAANSQTAPVDALAPPQLTAALPPTEIAAVLDPAVRFGHFEAGFQALDPRWVIVERTAGWIFVGVVAVLGGVGLVVFGVMNWPPGWGVAAASFAYVMSLLLFAWANVVQPPLSYRHAAWRLNDSGLEIRQGIWWRTEITVPLARVQHTDVHQGPLMRKYGLAKLVIHTAGTQDASIELGGLALETAHRLRDALVAQCEVKHGN